jgi:hypothetical protein
MKVKLKTLYANDKKILQIGEIGDFSELEGRALVKSGSGVEVGKPEVEKAVIKPAETALHPTIRPEKIKIPVKKVQK